jgi:hypothetical protein|tara:strand:+ start:3621 stop:5396 length:1776 start_codon:yes stop_codon:yes gene_type:complete
MGTEQNLDFSQYSADEVKRAFKIAAYNDDLELFCGQELKIVTKNMGLQPFRLYGWQQKIASAMREQLKKIGRIRQLWFKCRQPGGSSFASGTISRLVFLNPYVKGFVVAQDKTTVGTLFGLYDCFYENLSLGIKPQRQYFTKGTSMYLGNPNLKSRDIDPGLRSSLIVGEAKNINVGTGQTVHAVHVSELARMASTEGIKDSLVPAFSDGPGTIGIYESTAHWAPGAATWKSMCERAIRGEGEWEYHFLKWWEQPEYRVGLDKDEFLRLTTEERHLLQTIPDLTVENLKWRRKKIEDLDGDIFTFKANYPFSFDEAWVPLGHSAFPVDRLYKMKEDLRPPKRTCEMTMRGEMFDDPEKGRFSIWHEPQSGRSYDIGVDSAEGIEGGDYTCAEVIERGSNRQVAEWRGHVDPHEFGDILYHLGTYYNNAQIAPEVEKYGLPIVVRLQELCYPNIHIWQKRDTVVPKYTNFFGWSMTNNSKIILVALARHLIWNNQVEVQSDQLWRELMNYVRDTTPTGMHTYNAGPDENDDCVVAWMIALRVSKDEAVVGMESELYHKQERTKEKYRDPAHYDAEGLKSAGIHSGYEETKAW